MNRYLMDRAYKKGMRMQDGHHQHYPRRTMREMERMQMQPPYKTMDYNYYSAERNSRHIDRNYGQPIDTRYDMGYQQPREYHRPMDYAMYGYGVGGIMPMDYRYDYASEDMEKEWKEDLKEWEGKLKREDRFNMPKDQVVNNARQMGATFKDYNDDEFYITYLMIVSDYKKSISDPHIAILQAKEWLEDEDSELKGSDKLCAYYYEIINKKD